MMLTDDLDALLQQVRWYAHYTTDLDQCDIPFQEFDDVLAGLHIPFI